jgi:IS5 family transposase
VHKREEVIEAHPQVNWHVAMMPSHRKALNKETPMGAIMEALEKTKARIRARVKHPFRVIKRQFGYFKVRYRGLAKNTAQLHTLIALSNTWMVRRILLKQMTG